MKKTPNPVRLSRETLRNLEPTCLPAANGAALTNNVKNTCLCLTLSAQPCCTA
jgi:hypothetical protein